MIALPMLAEAAAARRERDRQQAILRLATNIWDEAYPWPHSNNQEKRVWIHGFLHGWQQNTQRKGDLPQP